MKKKNKYLKFILFLFMMVILLDFFYQKRIISNLKNDNRKIYKQNKQLKNQIKTLKIKQKKLINKNIMKNVTISYPQISEKLKKMIIDKKIVKLVLIKLLNKNKSLTKKGKNNENN